jgi:uncharacterized protein
MKAIDFHTHAFPDFLAARAVRAIADSAVMQHPHLDGTIAGLLRSMDRAGIELSVVASIATAEKQVASILKWSREIASDRIVPFPSVYPFSPDAPDQVRRVADAGLKGIKLHPLYQNFDPLDDRVFPIYQAVADAGLILLFHSGNDLAFLGDHRCLPSRMIQIKQRVPALKIVLAHLGGFWQYTDFDRHVLGTDAYVELSLAIPDEPSAAFTHMVRDHTPGRVMFGTDSPWSDQKTEIEKLTRAIDDRKLLEAVLWTNPARLLGMQEETYHG